MSAIDVAGRMRGPVETFDGFAHLEVGALEGEDERLAALVGICDDALERSQAFRAAEPPDPDDAQASRPSGLRALLGGLAGVGADERVARQRAAHDAWFEQVEAFEVEASSHVAAWRSAVDATWLEAALADRDAALELLVERDAATREMVDIVREHPFGDLLLRAALAWD